MIMRLHKLFFLYVFLIAKFLCKALLLNTYLCVRLCVLRDNIIEQHQQNKEENSNMYIFNFQAFYF
jgi:hypothetical protein